MLRTWERDIFPVRLATGEFVLGKNRLDVTCNLGKSGQRDEDQKSKGLYLHINGMFPLGAVEKANHEG